MTGKGFGAIEMDMTGVGNVLGDVAIVMESVRSEKFVKKIEKFIHQKAYLSLINAKQYGRGGKQFADVKEASADHYDKLKKMFPNIYEPEPPGQVTGTLIDTIESNPKKYIKEQTEHKEVGELVLTLLLGEQGQVYHILSLQKKIQEKEERQIILYSFMKVEVKEVVLQDRLHQLLQVSNFMQQENFKT